MGEYYLVEFSFLFILKKHFVRDEYEYECECSQKFTLVFTAIFSKYVYSLKFLEYDMNQCAETLKRSATSNLPTKRESNGIRDHYLHIQCQSRANEGTCCKKG